MKKYKSVPLKAFRHKFSDNPIVPGYYYFYGSVCSHLVKEFVTVHRYADPLTKYLFVSGVEYSSMIEDFVGFWWGPVLAPWEPGSMYKRLEKLEREYYQLVEDFNYAATQPITSSAPCPMCEYAEGGIFVKACSLHQFIYDNIQSGYNESPS